MKKVKIGNINFNAELTKDGTGFIFSVDLDKKNVNLALKEGANKIVAEIQKSLDTKFTKGQFFFRGGTAIENGITFMPTKKESLLDKL